MIEIPAPDKPFEIVCTTCAIESAKQQVPYVGMVSHNYIIATLNHLIIQYNCRTCGASLDIAVETVEAVKARKKFKKGELKN